MNCSSSSSCSSSTIGIGSLSLTSLSCNCLFKYKTQTQTQTLVVSNGGGGGLRMDGVHLSGLVMKRPNLKTGTNTIIMSDRSKNRRQLQRGRISIEAIQTVQSLKRAKRDSDLLERVFESKFRRLIKSDMIAVLRELQRQNQSLLALQVFEDVQKEYWYKPQLMIYADMIAVLANDGLFDKVELIFSSLKMEEKLEADIDGFNALLRTLMEFNIHRLSMECFHLIKAVGCEPDRSTFRILINGFEAKGETGLSAILRMEAEKYFGEPLEFLDEEEEMKLSLLESYRAISCRKASYR